MNQQAESNNRELVHCVWDFYDLPRTGIADLNGVACHFEAQWDESTDEYARTYALRLLGSQTMELVDEYNELWRAWTSRFRKGLTHGESNPHGTDARFDELAKSLAVIIKELDVVAVRVPSFVFKPDSEQRSEYEVVWERPT